MKGAATDRRGRGGRVDRYGSQSPSSRRQSMHGAEGKKQISVR